MIGIELNYLNINETITFTTYIRTEIYFNIVSFHLRLIYLCIILYTIKIVFFLENI